MIGIDDSDSWIPTPDDVHAAIMGADTAITGQAGIELRSHMERFSSMPAAQLLPLHEDAVFLERLKS